MKITRIYDDLDGRGHQEALFLPSDALNLRLTVDLLFPHQQPQILHAEGGIGILAQDAQQIHFLRAHLLLADLRYPTSVEHRKAPQQADEVALAARIDCELLLVGPHQRFDVRS